MVLGLNDLVEVLDELYDVRAKWYDIGLRLKVPAETLEKIRGPDDNSCLRQVLTIWLRSGNATWPDLCQVLRHRTIDQEKLANALLVKSSAKKRPASDASHPSAIKKSKPSVELPDSFTIDDFAKRPPADRICVKCNRVPFSPQRSVCCNRLYCEPCSKKNKQCRKHKAELQYASDKELYTKIQKLKVKCPNRNRRCDWTDTVFNLKNHLPTCGGRLRPLTKDKDTAATSRVNTAKETSKSMVSHPIAGQKEDGVSTTVTVGREMETKGANATDGQFNATEHRATGDHDPHGSISCPKAPPLNIVMKNISEYKESTGKTWYSPTFLSHQLGYKLRLAVKMQPQPQAGKNLHLEIGIVSAPEAQEFYLKFPCRGDADVFILNPQQNKKHKYVYINDFEIDDESKSHNGFTMASVPLTYVYKDCLFFCVEEIHLDPDSKTWLLDPNRDDKDSDSVDSDSELD